MSVCVRVHLRTSFGISSWTQGRGFLGLLSSSPLVTTCLITQRVGCTHTGTQTHAHTHSCVT